MDERTTAELIEKLSDDVARCHRELVALLGTVEPDGEGNVYVEYEYHARQLIRAIFAYFEGVTFSVKVSSIARCDELEIETTDHERYLAVEVDSALTDKGEVEERSAHLKLASNIRFAFRLLDRAHGGTLGFDPSARWWSDLMTSIRVRDRLMHPKMPGDLDISGDELTAALRAMSGFELMLYKVMDGVEPSALAELADLVK
jgi:hypothetical protein